MVVTSKNEKAAASPTTSEDHGLIALMIQRLNMENFPLVNLSQMAHTLQYCEKRIETVTEIVVKGYPTMTDNNLLMLLSAIREVFDAISGAANTVEISLNDVVGCVDLAVVDVQIGLQVLVEALISNCDVDEDTNTPSMKISDDATASAVYCLTSAVKNLLTSMTEMVEKMSVSSEVVDANIVPGLQMIVQTVLSIVDRVLYCLKHLTIMDLEDVEPSLEKFSLIIQRLTIQRMSFSAKISPMVTSPIADILKSLKPTVVNKLPSLSRKNVDKMVMAVASVEDQIHEKNMSESITALLDALHPMLVELSSGIHSIEGITDAVAYSSDLSLQSLMAGLKCLTYYIALVSKLGPSDVPMEDDARNIQTMLCFIASTIQTLVDGVTAAAERALVNLTCLSPTIQKSALEQKLLELQTLMEPIFLSLESVIAESLKLMQQVLVMGACAMGNQVELIKEVDMLVNNMQRIVKEILESALSSKGIEAVDSEVSKMITKGDDSVLTVCARSFESVAKNTVRLRAYVNESINQIRSFLIQM